MEMTNQAAVQSVLALAAHGVPAHRAAGAARQAWLSARVVPGHPTAQQVYSRSCCGTIALACPALIEEMPTPETKEDVL